MLREKNELNWISVFMIALLNPCGVAADIAANVGYVIEANVVAALSEECTVAFIFEERQILLKCPVFLHLLQFLSQAGQFSLE